jgi:hypothetical protein
MGRLWLSILAVVLVALAAAPLAAQPVAPSKSGMVSYIEGEVRIDDQIIPDPIVAQFPYMKENGTLRTGEGRAEVQMLPGWAMRLGEHSLLRMVTNRFIDTRVELAEGSAVVQVPEIQKDNSLAMVLGSAVITIAKAGDYHFDASPARLKVFAGEANVKIGSETLFVAGGKMVNLGGALASVEKFNKEETDALDRWSARRGELAAAANPSSSKQVYDTYGSGAPCYSTIGNPGIMNLNPGPAPCVGTLRWNPWYGMWTYIPYGGLVCDPFWGYCYYNPMRVYSTYYAPPPPVIYRGPTGFGGGNPGYETAAPTSSGYSGTMANSVSTVASSPTAGVGHAASSSASVAASGGGSAASGSRGK